MCIYLYETRKSQVYHLSFQNFFHLRPRNSDTLDLRCFNAVADDFQDGTVAFSELFVACSWIEKELKESGFTRKISVSPYAPTRLYLKLLTFSHFTYAI